MNQVGKLGILTFHRADNYGAVLQGMALVKTLERLAPDWSVQTVDYRNEHLEEPYHRPVYRCDTRNPVKYGHRFLMNLVFYRQLLARRENFDIFRQRYLRMTPPCSAQELKEAEQKFDLLITGSDQVWNKRIVGCEDDDIYTLHFAEGALRAAYAASAGSSSMIGQGTLEKLRGLDRIAVREAELKRYLEQKLERPVEQTVDPVFLLSRQEWGSLLNEERIWPKPYVFVYCVSNLKKEVSAIARRVAEEKDCDIIYIDPYEHYGRRGNCMYEAGPLDFVRLIRDAEAVVASSFHAAAFSVIFEKELLAVPIPVTGGRVVELLNYFGMESCVVDANTPAAEITPDQWARMHRTARSRLESYSRSSVEYLTETLKKAKERLSLE